MVLLLPFVVTVTVSDALPKWKVSRTCTCSSSVLVGRTNERGGEASTTASRWRGVQLGCVRIRCGVPPGKDRIRTGARLKAWMASWSASPTQPLAAMLGVVSTAALCQQNLIPCTASMQAVGTSPAAAIACIVELYIYRDLERGHNRPELSY